MSWQCDLPSAPLGKLKLPPSRLANKRRRRGETVIQNERCYLYRNLSYYQPVTSFKYSDCQVVSSLQSPCNRKTHPSDVESTCGDATPQIACSHVSYQGCNPNPQMQTGMFVTASIKSRRQSDHSRIVHSLLVDPCTDAHNAIYGPDFAPGFSKNRRLSLKRFE